MKRFIVTQQDLETVVERGLDTNVRNHIEDSYNGWTNRETWTAYLIMTNVEELFDTARELSSYQEAPDRLRKWWYNASYMVSAGQPANSMITVGQLLEVGSLWRVNWDEITTALKGG